MARKIDLRGLYESGQLTATKLSTGASSGHFLNLFDGDITTAYVLDDAGGTTIEKFRLDFNSPIQAKEASIRIRTRQTSDLTASINADDSTKQMVALGNNLATNGSVSQFNYSNTHISRIQFDAQIAYSVSEHSFREVELIINEETIPFEFNDSVLSTKAWNSTRYDGRQLSATTINEFNEGDTSYGGTPVLQNYSRNIYLGSRIIGMESGSIEDTSLLNFSGFSYITAHEFITVNDDLSITKTTVRGDIGTNTKQKKGFYRSWYHDFPIGSTIEVKLMDKQLQQSIKPNYEVFNNSGQLQKLLLVRQHSPISGSGYAATYRTSTNAFDYATGSGADLGASYTIFNKELLIDEFFTGSLIATPPPFVPGGVLVDPTIPGGD